MCAGVYSSVKLGGHPTVFSKAFNKRIVRRPVDETFSIKPSITGEQQGWGWINPALFVEYILLCFLSLGFITTVIFLNQPSFFSSPSRLRLTFSSSSSFYHPSPCDREEETACDQCQARARRDRQLSESE